ncbi:MAG: hypothetical protein DRR16_30205 [Candidatus Parabeggiatoa sp. nov. 3]|nr:MAG: hypothetical protein DRR00_22835 [Gammaproteobacteria bacterium]RKZ58711.1 MAG: hypothetical protein DRQ99_24975 [Gammaproteobacteria bacterium]RKZ76703.1 MAG: hypothetical protein DRR16_30205 [Gammaproteobacteria bacterium]
MKNNILEEDNVNPTSVLQLFENAFLKASLDEDEDIRITTAPGSLFLVKVLPDKKMLKYASWFGFKDGVSVDKKLAFLNQLNYGVILSRFSMPEENVLLSEYFLSYEEGIQLYQVINSFRLFERVTIGAIKQFDIAHLIE